MKNFQLSSRIIPGLAACILTLWCLQVGTRAAAGIPDGNAASARMKAARDEVSNVRSNIFITLVKLDEVRGQRDAGCPQFQVFTNQLARMEELAKAFGKRAQEMKEKGRAYFADWEARTAAIQDPEQRRKAEKGYTERQDAYNEITRFMEEARKNFMPFVEELNGIKAIIEGVRDQKNIAQAKELFRQANWHCIDVQRALLEIEAQFDRLAASFGETQSE